MVVGKAQKNWLKLQTLKTITILLCNLFFGKPTTSTCKLAMSESYGSEDFLYLENLHLGLVFFAPILLMQEEYLHKK